MTKAKALRALLTSGKTQFLMEAHNGLSARIAEEAGFLGLWGSGLAISASMGVRDANELSWTQILDIVEFISESTTIPLLLDGDTGYGNFNNVRRLVTKLESRQVAGLCLEDKVFPKRNSFVAGKHQLVKIEEFCGKIRAAKDTQRDSDFSLIARTESLVAGCPMEEALRRAEAYHHAGADAILIHSKSTRPDEVLAFNKLWAKRCPVVIIPTTYHTTPTELFRQAGFSIVIWANQLMRSSIAAMQETARALFQNESLSGIEERIVGVSEVFRLQRNQELNEAERLYLPSDSANG